MSFGKKMAAAGCSLYPHFMTDMAYSEQLRIPLPVWKCFLKANPNLKDFY